ncbi:MAG: ribonuclease D [Candidatus Competibacteraceae bacterium]
MMNMLYLDRPDALAEFCARLQNTPWLAIDTEFIREKTYYPQLCLIQVATEDAIACIDPLALPELDPLFSLLYDPTITKVLHAAYQDLEIFFHLRGTVPAPVFDTQLAATVLGYGEQIGYAALVKTVLGVELDKSQTRTDWSRRPLDEAQLAYAADDVRYLCQVYQRQRAELIRLERLDWLTEDFQSLSETSQYALPAEDLWQRIRGHQQLRGVQLAVLRALSRWREEQAITANRPRRWIAGDEVLLELARQLPKTLENLERIRGIEATLLRRHGRVLLELIARTLTEPAEKWPRLLTFRRLSQSQEALVDAMLAVVRLRGAQQSVSAQMLANRQDLERLLGGAEDIPLLHGWRAAVAGREVAALLRGERRLEVQGGELQIIESS